jgi:hypothetical protein
MKKSREILINLDRLNQKIDEYGLGGIVARAGINYTYLSGVAYPGTLARHLDLTDSPRGTFLVWPRLGEPRIVLNAFAEGLTRRDSWLEAIDVYEGYSEPPVERLAKVISDMGLTEETVRAKLHQCGGLGCLALPPPPNAHGRQHDDDG